MFTIPDPILSPFYPSTNGDLPGDLLPRCHVHLKALDQTIIEIEEKISRLRAELDSAEERHQRLSDERAKCTSLLAPIRRVPIEILSSIVLQLFDRTRLLERKDVKTIRNIQQVSKQWREATYVTCELWNNLKFMGDTDRINSDLPLGDILEGWFKRAGINSRLRLHLNIYYRQSDLQSLMAFFLESRSFVELNIWVEHQLFGVISDLINGKHVVSGRVSPSWGSLQYLTLKIYGFPIPQVCLSASALPRMTHLHVRGGRLTPFSHAGLQSLHIKGEQHELQCSALVSLLSQLPSLRKVVVDNAFSDNQQDYTRNDLEKLSKVTVTDLHLIVFGKDFPSLTNYFRFPYLKVLDLNLPVYYKQDTCQYLAALPSLESLTIQNITPQQLAVVVSKPIYIKKLHIATLDFMSYVLGPLPTTLKEVVIIANRPLPRHFAAVIRYFARHGSKQGETGHGMRFYSTNGWPIGISEEQACLADFGVELVGVGHRTPGQENVGENKCMPLPLRHPNPALWQANPGFTRGQPDANFSPEERRANDPKYYFEKRSVS